MKPTAVPEKSIPESVTTIPFHYPSVIPVKGSSDNATKWRVIGVVSVIATLLIVSAVVLSVRFPARNNDDTDHAMSDLEEFWINEAERQYRKNFEVAINYNGERCVESVHYDEMENIVTYHYTGENGREIDVAVYDYNQGLVAFKDGNNTHCFFASTSSLPNIKVNELQLASRNKEVLDVTEEIQFYVTGEIPSGFLQRSIGPVFADLCNGLPSLWLEDASQFDPGTGDDETARKKRGNDNPGYITISVGGVDITLPAGGSVTIIVLG